MTKLLATWRNASGGRGIRIWPVTVDWWSEPEPDILVDTLGPLVARYMEAFLPFGISIRVRMWSRLRPTGAAAVVRRA